MQEGQGDVGSPGDGGTVVEILGESFRLRGGSAQEVATIARFVNEKLDIIRARNEGLPIRRLLILTSLNIAEDLLRERREHERVIEQVEGRSRELRRLLETGFSPIQETGGEGV